MIGFIIVQPIIYIARCISGNTISNEYARINEILQSIDSKEFKKDKLASISYDYDTCTILYEAYAQAKVTIAENTMPSASNFEPACISSIRQKMISPTSYQSSNCKSNTSEIFISSQYAKQNNLLPFTKGTVLKLRDGTKVTIV
ncbi:hypothetical protein RhiirB3_458195 [Rhizophagus irregularis]|nr:hypothetical protein RhiirB3_458195 [Rhizophagus irregularis]